MTHDEIFRAAAAKVRETAKHAARAPWSTNGMWVMGADAHVAHFGGHLPNRNWVALMHPGNAEPLAKMFDTAEEYYRVIGDYWEPLLDLAHVILGQEA